MKDLTASIFDGGERDAETDELLLDFERRLAPLRFRPRPLDFDSAPPDADADRAGHAAPIPVAGARFPPPIFARAVYGAIAASLVLAAALGFWLTRPGEHAPLAGAVERPTLDLTAAAPPASPQPAATVPAPTADRGANRPPTLDKEGGRAGEATRVIARVAPAPATTPVRRAIAPKLARTPPAPLTNRRADPSGRATYARRAEAADTAGDLLLAIRITGDKLTRTGRQLETRLAAALTPDADLLRSFGLTGIVTKENRP